MLITDAQTSPVETMSLRELVCHFESLGDNCELGLAQRCCGAEPLGLLRFAFSRLSNVARAINDELAGIGDDEDFQFYVNPPNQEYQAISKTYNDFRYHSFVYADQIPFEKARQRELKKTRYLKDRLLADLASHEKIFVRKGIKFGVEIEDLHAALRRFGPNTLLWVVEADEEHPRGHVEVLKEGLLKGYISRHSPYSAAIRIDLEGWIEILVAALALARRIMGAPTPRLELPLNHVVDGDPEWRSDAHRLHGGDVKTLTLTADTRGMANPARCTMLLSTPPQLRAVLSGWVFVPADFRGRFIDVIFGGLAKPHSLFADLTKRDQWQRIWTSVHVPKGISKVTAVIRADAQAFDTIHLANWTLEEGFVPNPSEPPAHPPSVAPSVPVAKSPVRTRLAFALRAAAQRVEAPDDDELINRVASGNVAWKAFMDAAEAFRRQGKMGEADRVLTQAASAFPNDPDILVAHAWSAHQAGSYEIAVQRWRAALRVKPGDPMCHCGLAANLREFAHVDRAELIIGKALQSFPDNVAVISEAARVAHAGGRHERALELWTQVIAASDTPHPDWLHGRALSLLNLQRVDEAVCAIAAARAKHAAHTALATLEHRASLLRKPQEDDSALTAHVLDAAQ